MDGSVVIGGAEGEKLGCSGPSDIFIFSALRASLHSKQKQNGIVGFI